MKTSKLLFILLICMIFLPFKVSSQIIEPGWSNSYHDNMIATDKLKNGDAFEYDVYINFIRRIDNKFTEKGSDYTSIPSTVYVEIWACNLNTNGLKLGYFTLNGQRYTKQFENTFKSHWVLQDPVSISPFEVNSQQLMMYAINPASNGVDFIGEQIRLTDMSFPQYYIIAEAPSTISVKSEEDFTVKVANAKYVATSGFALPEPDAVGLYFCTRKLPSRINTFKTPVAPVPTPGGTWFSFVYPGKNVKADYDVAYFDVGEGAAVVKAAKQYPLQFTIKAANVDVRCLVTFVNIAEKTYQYIP